MKPSAIGSVCRSKKWIAATGATGLYAKAGRYGGFELGSWLRRD